MVKSGSSRRYRGTETPYWAQAAIAIGSDGVARCCVGTACCLKIQRSVEKLRQMHPPPATVCARKWGMRSLIRRSAGGRTSRGKVMKPKTKVMKIAIAVSLLATLTMAGAPENIAYGQSLEKLTVRFTWKLK